jgi:hypothetical protein
MQTSSSPLTGATAQLTDATVTRARSRVTRRAWLAPVAMVGFIFAGCASVPHASNECVGPASYCDVYKGS